MENQDYDVDGQLMNIIRNLWSQSSETMAS